VVPIVSAGVGWKVVDFGGILVEKDDFIPRNCNTFLNVHFWNTTLHEAQQELFRNP